MTTLEASFETIVRRVVREELAALRGRALASIDAIDQHERGHLLDVADRFALKPYVVHVLQQANGGPMHCKDIADRVYALGFEHKWPPKYADQLVRSINALASPSQHPETFERVGARVLKLR